MWTAHLFQVTTGDIGPKVSVESMSWKIDLNGTESLGADLRKSTLPKFSSPYWLEAWWGGLVFMWNGEPVVAGPIITHPTETLDVIKINCGGVRSVLQGRVLVNEQMNWDLLAASAPIMYTNMSLGTIAKRVVQDVQKKPAGSLPISYPIEDESSATADHQRTYQPFNLQNINADDILTKLSDVTDGPDVLFKPRLISDNRLTFDMWHGTEDQPRIQQSRTIVWDTTPAAGNISDISVVYTGTYQASRVYSTGAGTDAGLLIKVSSDDEYTQKGFPLLERVINTSNSEDPKVVAAHGEANLKANKKALVEIQMTIRGDGPVPFGKFWPGDLVHVYTEGWKALPDGLNDMRILSMTGGGSSEARVSLQLDDKFE